MTFKIHPIAACFMLLSGAVCADELPSIHLTLTPVVEHGKPVAMDVTETITSNKPLPQLVISKTLGPLQHIVERISRLKVSDSQGNVAIHEGNATLADALGQMPFAWKTARDTVGTVTVTYRVAVSHDTTPGPTWELRTEPKGISAAGNTFLVLPESEQTYAVSAAWDISALPKGSTTINSLPVSGEATPARIAATYFMAGDLARFNGTGKSAPFRAASTAEPKKFATASLLEWAHNAYQKYSDFLGFPALPPFTVTFRSNPMISKSGTELPDALMVAANNDIEFSDMTQILSHEMVHVYLHDLEGASWFQEGLAVMYENRAPFALGLIDADTYLKSVNNTLLTYYSNARKNMEMQAATAAFWTDARARLQPYYRGALYFIVTDSRIRMASGGAHNLDQLLVDFLARSREGKSVSAKDWLELVRQYIGADADKDYAAMQSGGLLVPEDGAFGRCFTREKVSMPLFDLGFDISSLMQIPRVIQGLNPHSPAAKAGLKEGDKVLKSVGLDEQQSKPSSPLTLLVERNGKPTSISFVPTGALTEGYQWQKKNGSAGETECRR
ncbi:hypothetical protein [Shewanella sp.]|uniref:hypothetical protein n=1 Tax=Shewanella sp. TaxID=50422 RepID=UPI003A96FA6C